jgi:hypothetical protein
MKTRFRPLFKSYVCRHRPTEVVIWNVVFPSGRVVKGTVVGETKPTVRKGANILDFWGLDVETAFLSPL